MSSLFISNLELLLEVVDKYKVNVEDKDEDEVEDS
jgi:hypothetical protein